VALFMARWGKVEIWPGHGFSGDEVGWGRNKILARTLLCPWSEWGGSAEGCHYGVHADGYGRLERKNFSRWRD
jgi:hypothetical protein